MTLNLYFCSHLLFLDFFCSLSATVSVLTALSWLPSLCFMDLSNTRPCSPAAALTLTAPAAGTTAQLPASCCSAYSACSSGTAAHLLRESLLSTLISLGAGVAPAMPPVLECSGPLGPPRCVRFGVRGWSETRSMA